MATDLDIQYDARGPRNPSTIRRLQTPRPALKAEWTAGGDLDVWIYEDGQWYGRFCDADQVYSWVAGRDLRPR